MVAAFDSDTAALTDGAFYFASAAHRQAASRDAAAAMADLLVQAGQSPQAARAFTAAAAEHLIAGQSMHRFTNVTRVPFAYLRSGVQDAFRSFTRAWARDNRHLTRDLQQLLDPDRSEHAASLYASATAWTERFWRPDTGAQNLAHTLRQTPPPLGRAVLGLDTDAPGLPVTLAAPLIQPGPAPAWHQVTAAAPPELGEVPTDLAGMTAALGALNADDQAWAMERASTIAAAPRTAQLLAAAPDADTARDELTALLRGQLHRGFTSVRNPEAAALFAADAEDSPARDVLAAMTTHVVARHRPDLATRVNAASEPEPHDPEPSSDIEVDAGRGEAAAPTHTAVESTQSAEAADAADDAPAGDASDPAAAMQETAPAIESASEVPDVEPATATASADPADPPAAGAVAYVRKVVSDGMGLEDLRSMSRLLRFAEEFAEREGTAAVRRATSAEDPRFTAALNRAFETAFANRATATDLIEEAFATHYDAFAAVVYDLARERAGINSDTAGQGSPEGPTLWELAEATRPEHTRDRQTPAPSSGAEAAPQSTPEREAEGPPVPPEPAAAPAPEAEAEASDYRPDGHGDLGATGSPERRAGANLAALQTLRALQAGERPATAEEQAVLAKWSGWGAAPQVFDEQKDGEFATVRTQLKELLSEPEYRAAAASTLNAHYTDAAFVQAIWQAVTNLGFRTGSVLEPGCGTGNFIGIGPSAARMTGVELDPTTAAIAQYLYPSANILPASFADIDAARDSFDLVVGNVPFHNSVIHDPAFNPNRHTTHNYFILKSLQLTRPGGLVAVITSSFTMDAVNPGVRREINGYADLVGAVRLPSRAHRTAAGTDALTDVLIFRRRAEDAEPAPGFEDWEMADPVSPDGTGPRMNRYFHARPQLVLGEVSLERNMYVEESVTVTGSTDPAEVARGLQVALSHVGQDARDRDLLMTAPPTTAAPAPVAAVATYTETPTEYFIAETEPGSGVFHQWARGAWRPYKVPKTQVKELRALLELRDGAVALVGAQAATIEDTDEVEALRERLNDLYDGYVRRYGPINRVSRTPRTKENPDTGEREFVFDPDTGRQKYNTRSPGQGGFRDDAHAMLVRALEHYNPVTGEARKMAILTERTLHRRADVLGADSAADALAISLDRTAGVDLDLIADLLGVDKTEAREQLADLVFDDPDTGETVTAAEYRSGDIRAKLDAARLAAEHNPAFRANIAALEAVCPTDLGPGEITPRLGRIWIPAADVQEFLREILGDQNLVVEHAGGATWGIDKARKSGPLATSEWGTERMPAPVIAENLLRGKPLKVERTILLDDGRERTVIDQTATDGANAKAEAMAEKFRSWLWADPERTDRLTEVYNRTFNSIVPRTYTGEHLTLPGLSSFYKLRPHQLAAVDRIINEPSVGLFHEVGAGKTLEMIVGAMELKRLGLATKPLIAVPNHMLEQFCREFVDAYPQANLLAASTADFPSGEKGKAKRREFLARIATGNWDAVITTHSAFGKLGLNEQTQMQYFEAEQAILEAKLEAAQGQRNTVKELQGAIKRIEARLALLSDQIADRGTDTDLTFEQTGIDYLFIDEAHEFKNLRRASLIESMSLDGSIKASDLHMKIEWLREENGGRHVASFATATPLPNSMAEAHTMMRYLRPDLLQLQDLLEFDAWANTFGDTTTQVEIAPEGGTRLKTRFAKFQNVPELMRMFHVMADIKLAADLDLPVPALAPRPGDGKAEPEIVAIAPSAAMLSYMDHLMSRAGRIRGGGVDPKDDNMLAIAGDGRAAAADVRLRYMEPQDEPQKADVAADKIAEIWQDTKDNRYTDPATGEMHPNPGALQLVFCDQGTPKPGEWSLYEQLRSNLVERGMDASRIRFIHEAKDDKQKAALFAAARAGEIDVLVGSTQKMGVGTNVQARIVALHHLDCPWRPADVVQREGRAIRQGNQNDEVRILRYVIEGSFDGYMWQTVARKAQFIAQVMRGDAGVREIEDVDEATLSYNEIKAIASGDPRILDHANAAAEVAKLESAERAHQQSLRQMKEGARWDRSEIKRVEGYIAEIDAALPRIQDTRGAKFTATVAGARYDEFTAANNALQAALGKIFIAKPPPGTTRTLGAFAGFEIEATMEMGGISLRLAGAPQTLQYINSEDLKTSQPFTRFRNALGKLPVEKESYQAQIARLREDIARAESLKDAPFAKAAELDAARARFAELDAELAGPGATDLPPLAAGAVRIDFRASEERIAVTEVTEERFGQRFFALREALDSAGFLADHAEAGTLNTPITAAMATGRDKSEMQRVRDLETALGVPIQYLVDGEFRYETEARALPTLAFERVGNDDLFARAVTEERLGDLYPVVIEGLRKLGFEPKHQTDDWRLFSSHPDRVPVNLAETGPRWEREVGVPITGSHDGDLVYWTPPELTNLPLPDGHVRLVYSHTEQESTLAIEGVSAARLGADKIYSIGIATQRLPIPFKEAAGFRYVATMARKDEADKLLAEKAPLFEQGFGVPVQFVNAGRLIYQTPTPTSAPVADGAAAAKSAAAALGSSRPSSAPVSPAAPATTPQPETERTR